MAAFSMLTIREKGSVALCNSIIDAKLEERRNVETQMSGRCRQPVPSVPSPSSVLYTGSLQMTVLHYTVSHVRYYTKEAFFKKKVF